MPMPRVVSGTAPSAAVFNALAAEIDRLGIGCKVKRTSAVTGIPTATDLLVSWQTAEFDSFAGTATPMWSVTSPNFVTIQVDGTYALVLQERWAAVANSSPYTVGQRAGKIMVNGSNVTSNSVTSDKRPADGTGEGVTVSMRAGLVPLYAGDLVYCNYWHSGGAAATGLHTDYGGTYLAVARRGPVT